MAPVKYSKAEGYFNGSYIRMLLADGVPVVFIDNRYSAHRTAARLRPNVDAKLREFIREHNARMVGRLQQFALDQIYQSITR